MLISHSWLQTYFKKKLPTAEKVADILTFTAFEIESVEDVADDSIIDVKVLPDRAHYCLCHRGVAGELAAAMQGEILKPEVLTPETKKIETVSLTVESPNDCRRYIGRRVKGIEVAASPEWLQKPLQSLGQRSINAVVDAANFVMFDMGQPLHAFDADKVSGTIKVRKAMKGEKITTLDNKEVVLDAETLVIADNVGPLAIAGIKGGKRAEVTAETTNIILEAANFNPGLIRKTAERLQIKTDASKRFENEITAELALKAMHEFSALLFKLCPKASFGEIVDQYLVRSPQKQFDVEIESVSKKLGIELSMETVKEILERLSIQVTSKSPEVISVTIPSERLDISIPEDIVEEVGRLYGYEKIEAKDLPRISGAPKILKSLYWETKIRLALREIGFSEIMTSSFEERGEVAIEKPLAADKAYLRPNLSDNMHRILKLNSANAPLWGDDQIKLFEIGKIFSEGMNESTHCAIGFSTGKKKSNETLEALKMVLEKQLGVKISESPKNGVLVLEIDLTLAIAKLPSPKEWDIISPAPIQATFKPFSSYPFIVRDIAVFVPVGVLSEEVWKVIGKGLGKASALLVHHSLFDVFTKQFPDGSAKTSYAFHLVFQSFERTLTDEEINPIMEAVNTELKASREWQVR